MTPQSARSVKRWQARAAVLRALPSVCPDEVRELIAHTRRAFTPAAPLSRSVRADQMFEPDEDDEFNDSRREHTVRVWAARHGLDREWLIGPLWSMMNWAHVQKADVLVDADLWVQQIWQIEDFSRLELEKLDLMNTWRNPIAPKPSALPREKVARAAHQRAWLRQCREWAEQTTPLQPIEADPSVERRRTSLLARELTTSVVPRICNGAAGILPI